MARNDSKSPAKNRPASAKAAGRNKLQRPTKTQTSAKPKERRVKHMDAVAKLLADPKANPKLKALVRKQFPVKGRAQRIARAERAWKEAMEIAATFKLDNDTWKWIAQSKELEDI